MQGLAFALCQCCGKRCARSFERRQSPMTAIRKGAGFGIFVELNVLDRCARSFERRQSPNFTCGARVQGLIAQVPTSVRSARIGWLPYALDHAGCDVMMPL